MRPRSPIASRRALFIERLVWHAAAGAALGVMILVLLLSLRLLDRVSPRTPAVGTAPPASLARPLLAPDEDRDAHRGASRPSG